VRGTVQGVGFRPFVLRRAESLQLTGFVRNQAGSILIEVEGPVGLLDQFVEDLLAKRPPLSRIESLSWRPIPLAGDQQEQSGGVGARIVRVPPDLATCANRLPDMFDSTDCRFEFALPYCAKGLRFRRSHRYTPQSIPLPVPCVAPTLAVGGQSKATFALAHQGDAFLRHDFGDMASDENYQSFEQAVEAKQRELNITPQQLVHDLHPDYSTTHFAYRYARKKRVKLVAVQHHHAHMASCMAETGLNEPVLGVIFDGPGYGTDGAMWGGEVLLGDYRHFHRVAQLRYVSVPSGQSIRQPWQMALSYLLDAGRDPELAPIPAKEIVSATNTECIAGMIERRMGSATSSSVKASSMGLLFDAVAAISGVRSQSNFDGQAAMELEMLASDIRPCGRYPWAISDIDHRHSLGEADDHIQQLPKFVVDTRPLIAALEEDARCGKDASTIARRFHTTVVELAVDLCLRIRNRTLLNTVVLSGDLFANRIITTELSSELKSEGFRVVCHRRLSPGDRGLTFGQLAVAAARTQGISREEVSPGSKSDCHQPGAFPRDFL